MSLNYEEALSYCIAHMLILNYSTLKAALVVLLSDSLTVDLISYVHVKRLGWVTGGYLHEVKKILSAENCTKYLLAHKQVF
jgi:hypothetical protein